MSENRNEVDISQLTFEQIKKIREYLKKLIENGGSDLHVKSNGVIRARINGTIVPFSGSIFSYDDAMSLAKEILRGRYAELVENKEVDLVYQFDERNRFRVNIFFQTDGPSFVFRVIPMTIPTIDQMNFPETIRTFTKESRGLILVTGTTGSGKSTTLAAMIHEINTTQKKHIITIEDPIEFVHKDRGCIINQRSVGQDTLSFDRALRAALREDPDIILVGEMRDRETIELALHAADTGHLVFSTLHTIDAKETINRIIAIFPNEEQNRVRLSLAGVLKGVVSQRLIPTIDDRRVAAMEILVKTPTIEKLILENRDYEIREAIEKGREHYKSQSFDQHILDIYNEGIITKEKAKDYATSAADLELKMNGLNTSKPADYTNIAEKKEKYQKVADEDVFDLK
ncbi:MAG: type IV pili twitching motility protein PilT [Sulfurimonas sp. RIFCSPHIGHO2_12_FULL_36_9]|uniref:type IV pilus twitching motility protein PilT n=1 Tax=Sulfurimonas sp. RIFCSPLOWO2_12_36_12 TaxID=1802253 RepID=UPI0008AF96B7|nr:PilT/PilU family type 4a pilus ATPase [Sulfurimonas sp. RIFCSPLOWO2_12_36_12]OHD96904.1 MAG: type IV pili twitching motility protein PilT [Sulfurimonas sp. RIFCSPHIGHO2_12_FULL_36_9]OHE00570.1 MAG: type IV pili twitching motility protein PilT [Sulfurimonas sp. RIFCSPLOWO2_02_FULL_36_28]OHE01215.1 MAG: type IV pili twitching motility protein PilT [Sulfurimonas sp. RIFCSPLOWO2_12_36_12]